MRWFWLFIASLALLTVVMYTTRVRAERAQQAAMQAQAERDAPSTPMRRSRQRAERTPEADDDRRAQSPADSRPTQTPDRAPNPEPDQQPDRQPDTQPESARPEAGSERLTDESLRDQSAGDGAEPVEAAARTPESPSFDPSALITAFNEADAQRPVDAEPTAQADPAPEPQSRPGTQPATQQTAQEGAPQESEPAADGFEQALAQAARENSGEQPASAQDGASAQAQTQDQTQAQQARADGDAPRENGPRTYELRPDGSFRVIEADVWVQGAGTAAEPYVLSWDVLKTVEKSYDPRNGKETIPDWLNHLDGKVVQIEGNTLVPVVATTTRELLVMQNPWDGCCIGVPPTPYDAVEVALDHDVDFGNTAVGFGSVLGTFYLDPYIVDGWVLGLYLIEDAQYRSGEGVEFPQF